MNAEPICTPVDELHRIARPQGGGTQPKPLSERFWPKVRKTDGCWEWIGSVRPNSYGQVRGANGRTQKAHRVAYELLVGPIPPGLQLDHLCRNRKCVNPAHLEPVTQRVNILRGESPAAKGARATECPQGHPYDDENTRIKPGGGRDCRACAAEFGPARYRAWRDRQRGEI